MSWRNGLFILVTRISVLVYWLVIKVTLELEFGVPIFCSWYWKAVESTYTHCSDYSCTTVGKNGAAVIISVRYKIAIPRGIAEKNNTTLVICSPNKY